MTSLKRSFLPSLVFIALTLGGAQFAAAQGPPPVRVTRPSPGASVMQTIGVTDVTITYSRPGVKGRAIWGDSLPEQAGTKGEATLDNQNLRPKGAPIVPWGHAWRTGANEATQFVVTDDVFINGQKLPAGSYSLHTIPTKDEFTIIFNSVANQWGSFNYDAAKDTLRVKVKPVWEDHSKEWLEYWIDPVNDNSAQVNIRWEKVRVPFTVEVKDVMALTLVKARASVAAAKPDDFVTRLQAANFALQNKLSVEEAMGWLEQSIKIKQTMGNVGLKARVLAEQGKTADAITAGEQAIQLGKDAKANAQAIANLEKLVAEWKAKK
jgi:ribosomal protein S4